MDERKLRLSLRRVTILFTVISLVILGCGAFASFSLNQIFESTRHEQTTAQIREYRSNLTRKVDSNLQLLHALASFIEFSPDSTDDSLLLSLYEANNRTSFLYMAYFDAEDHGVQVSYYGSVEDLLTLDQMAPEAQEIVLSARTGESAVSSVYYDEILDQEVVTFAVPIWLNNQINGVLMASESISAFNQIMNQGSMLSDQGVTAVVDTQGRIFSGSTRVTSTGLEDVYHWESISDQDKEALMNALKLQERTTLSLEIYDYSCYALVEPTGIRDWSIVLIDTKNGISDPLYQNMLVTRITSILPLLLAVACIFYGYQQMRRSNQELLKLAYYDSLTGAYNMEKFNRLLEEGSSQGATGCVAALNIRHFKFVNELFGMEQANHLLCHIKHVLDNHMKKGEFFCRESADAFFLFLQEEDREVVVERMEEIFTDVGHMALNRHQKYPIVLYCGVAFLSDCSQEGGQKEELMIRVMFALHRAKLKNPSPICFYDLELHKTEQLQNYIESHMRQALQDGEFQMYLQPKMDLRTGTLGGAEALVRWITKEGRTIFPDQFIPLFEENGFCIQLDLHMVELACHQLRTWIDAGLSPMPIAVNQSKLLFYEDNYVDSLCAITQRHQISPCMITLEILEGLALSSVTELNSRILQLKSHGFRISMDDFGSGYSSLNTLGSLDIDELKLDRAFLMAAAKAGGERQRLIMEQIIVLARKMQISTVAEGVETQEDEEMISRLGCDCGQGYYYSRPIPVADFETRYLSHKTEATP